MALSLSGAWRERPGPVGRFLRAALALDAPSVSALVEAGVPHWDATALLRRLVESGEVGAGGWDPRARAAYGELLREPPAAAPLLQRLPEGERPREKALERGIESLGDAELLAVLLRTGAVGEGVLELAQRLLAEHGGLVGLARLTPAELAALPGLGEAKAVELAAAFALGARLAAAQASERPRLDRPEAVADFVQRALAPLLLPLPHEELWCLPLDSQCRLLGRPRAVTRGDVDGVDAGPRAFFRIALAAGAVQAIAVHNHPSGDPTPSAADWAVTERLCAAGRTLDIALCDHLIIGQGGRYAALRSLDPSRFR
ncbi:MAG: DNA repair protein RadC [Planctomycetota bacterium]|nr:DNA repair protein RadC [Planctomycetota bacterium]MCX8040849.1 DNA repair protein RadC [Planctomycetota bacterium]MDW8373858.1 DNA repair protein RadC [Planctomycetota bacterium]